MSTGKSNSVMTAVTGPFDGAFRRFSPSKSSAWRKENDLKSARGRPPRLSPPWQSNRFLPSTHPPPRSPAKPPPRAALRPYSWVVLALKFRPESQLGDPITVNQAINEARGPRLTGQGLTGIVPAPIQGRINWLASGVGLLPAAFNFRSQGAGDVQLGPHTVARRASIKTCRRH